MTNFNKEINNNLPLETTNLKPSKELLEALEEGETIIQEIKDGKRTGYNNIRELINALTEE